MLLFSRLRKSVCEIPLCTESIDYFRSCLKTAKTDSRTDRCFHFCRITAVSLLHQFYRLRCYAGQSSPPSGMNQPKAAITMTGTAMYHFSVARKVKYRFSSVAMIAVRMV